MTTVTVCVIWRKTVKIQCYLKCQDGIYAVRGETQAKQAIKYKLEQASEVESYLQISFKTDYMRAAFTGFISLAQCKPWG